MSRRKRRGPTLGSIIHRDSSGRKVGYSEPNIIGGYVDYDRHGRIIGQSESDKYGGYHHHDGWGRKIGHSEPGEYVHNPDDAFFKTGSYQPKNLTTPISSGAYPAGYYGTKKPYVQLSTDSIPTHEDHLKDLEENYRNARTTFGGCAFTFFLLLWLIALLFDVVSEDFVGRIVFYGGIALILFGSAVVSSYHDFKFTRQLWKEEKHRTQVKDTVSFTADTCQIPDDSEPNHVDNNQMPVVQQDLPTETGLPLSHNDISVDQSEQSDNPEPANSEFFVNQPVRNSNIYLTYDYLSEDEDTQSEEESQDFYDHSWELEMADLDEDELRFMNPWDREEALLDAGLDPDDFEYLDE